MNKHMDGAILRYVGYGVLALGVVLLAYLVRGALPVFFVGGLIAYALEPVLRNLERRGWSRRGAVGFMFFVFVLLLMLGMALLASAFQQAQQLGGQVGKLVENGEALVERAQTRVQGLPLPEAVKASLLQSSQQLQQQASARIPNFVQGAISFVLSSVGSIAIGLIVLPIITLWLMMEANPLRARMLMLVPPQYRRDVTTLTESINELLGRYVRGQIIICSSFGLLCTLTFLALSHFFGMAYPLVLGVLAGLVYIVPYIGMATVALSAGLIGYFTSTSPLPCAVIAVVSCVVFNLVLDYGVAPRVLGQGVGLHPLMVIFALLCGNQLGGPLGMILSVPFFAALRVIAIHLFPQLTAPIPLTPPESHHDERHDTTQEVVRQTLDAEAQAPAPVVPLATASQTPSATLREPH